MAKIGVTDDYSTAAGRKALECAFAVIMAAADNSELASASSFLTLGRGTAARSDREYAIALLDIVNYNMLAEANPDASSEAYEQFIRGERRGGFTSMYGERLQRLVQTLDEIRTNQAAATARHAAEWDRACEGCVLSIPRFERTRRGLEAKYRTIIVDVEAAYAHVLRLLASPPLCDQLMRCELRSCQRFFLFDPQRSGPPPSYCIGNNGECARQAKRQKTLARVRKYRQGKKAGRRRSK